MGEILTIAIPTFNRARCLERQLCHLLLQNDERVVILVSDNASCDDTQEVVCSFQGRMPNLRYTRNDMNLGFDGNLLSLYEKVSTEYIWFLSDDDIVVSDAVPKVLDLLSWYEPTVAVMGSCQESVDTSKRSLPSGPIRVIESLNSVEDYRIFSKAIFLSGLMVRKLPGIEAAELSGLTGTNFFQVSLSMVLLSKRFRLCDAPTTVVVQREVGYLTRTEIGHLWFVGPARAMHLPQYGYDMWKVRECVSRSWGGFVTLVIAAKLGMYRINPALSSETARQIKVLLGRWTICFVRSCLILYRITPAFPLKGVYWLRCVLRFGIVQGIELFHKRTGQAFSPKFSGF